RLGHLLRALAQGVERLALRVHGTVGIALAELVAGVAHGAVGGVETVVAVLVTILIAVLARLSLIALLTLLLPLLAFLTLLALLRESPLGEFVLELLQPIAERLLVLLQVGHALVALLALLLAAHAVAPGILPLLEGLVAQLLLLADHVAELV